MLSPHKSTMGIIIILALSMSIQKIAGHGRLMDPPSRSSIWRLPEFSSYSPPINYDDNQLFCGGLHQEDNPGTNCGVCGDPLDQSRPRDNEIGGVYYNTGYITRAYNASQVNHIIK
jgi:hypothetical protein